MFPVFDFDTTIQAEEKEQDVKIGKSFVFDFKSKRFNVVAGKVKETTEEEAIRQWIELLLRTAVDKYKVYEGTGFGTNIDKLVGYKSMRGFVESEMKREISEKIIMNMNRVIERIENFKTDFEGSMIEVSFTVILKNKKVLEVASNV